MTRRPIVGVMGSGVDEHVDTAEPLGRLLAHEGVHLLTGGGRGVMTAVTRAFVAVPERRGLALGVLPSDPSDVTRARDGYPNAFVEVPIRTHLPLSGTEGEGERSRNSINVLSADVVLVLPGGAGTASEARLAVRYGKSVAAVCFGAEEAPSAAGVPSHLGLDVLRSEGEVRAFLREALTGFAG